MERYRTLKNCNIPFEDVGLFTEFRDYVDRREFEERGVSSQSWHLVQYAILEFLKNRCRYYQADPFDFAFNHYSRDKIKVPGEV